MEQEMQFEFINENEMEFAKRGRKSNLDEKFVNSVKEMIKKNDSVAKKQFVIISSLAIPSDLTDIKEIKNYKAKVAAMLRTLAKNLGYGSEIRWHKETVPAIRFTSVKGKTK
jgi:hypothetical protein